MPAQSEEEAPYLVYIVTGGRRYSSDLPQGELEIPCKVKFTAKKTEENDRDKL